MVGTPEELPIVGRGAELAAVTKALEKAGQGKPMLVLLTGESGVGKTRIAREAIRLATEKGWRALPGKCLHGTLTPYMPLTEAFSEGKLEHLMEFSKPPRVEEALLIFKDGRLCARSSRKQGGLDRDIFAGMLYAVASFVRDSFSAMTGRKEKTGGLNVMGYEDYRVLVDNRPWGSLALVITGEENEILKDELAEVTERIGRLHGDVLESWTGETEPMKPVEHEIGGFITSGRYDGVEGLTEPENRHWRLLNNVTHGIARASKEQPTLLFLDDIQWADPSSLGLVLHLLRHLDGTRLVVLVTCRTEEMAAGHTLLAVRKELEAGGLVVDIPVARLGARDIRQMVALELGEPLAKGEVGTLIERESGGNAYLVKELLAWLREEGLVVKEGGGWTLTGKLGNIGVPRRVEETILARVMRLSKEERQVVETGAVIGEEFRPGPVAWVMGLQQLQVRRALHEVELNHKLVRALDGGVRYRFDHRLVREAVYNSLPEALRQECHRSAVECLEREGGRDMRHLTELAYHSKAGKHPKAVAHLRSAGDAARRDYQNAVAAKFYDSALVIATKNERDQLIELLGETEFHAGRFEEADAWFGLGVKETRIRDRKVALTARRARALDRLGMPDEALHIMESERPGPHIAHLIEARWRSTKAWLLFRKQDLDGADREVRAALQTFEETGGTGDDLADCWNTLGSVESARGRLEKAAAAYAKGLEVAQKGGARYQTVRIMLNLCPIEAGLENIGRALDMSRRGLHEADRLGDRLLVGGGLFTVGTFMTWAGSPEEGLEYLNASVRLAEDMSSAYIETEARQGRALCMLELGRPADAVEDARAALKLSGEQGVSCAPMVTLSEALVADGKPEEAAAIARRAIENGWLRGAELDRRMAARNLGLALAALGDQKESNGMFEEALEGGGGSMGAFEYARGLRWWGEALLSWGERERARDKLESAQDRFAVMGADGELRKVRTAIARLIASGD